MKLSEVLIKPILTEKANAQQEKLRVMLSVVSRKANKLEIKKAVEEFYGVHCYRCEYSCMSRKKQNHVLQKLVLYQWPKACL